MSPENDPLSWPAPIMMPFNLTSAENHMIISGSFRSFSLFLLAFSPRHRSLSLIQRIEGPGPNQNLELNHKKDRLYTTSWTWPPTLSSWQIQRPGEVANDNLDQWRVHPLNNVPITATSSYVTIPPPYTHAYSVGGPAGEVHVLDPTTGAFGEKIQEVLFIPPEQLEQADKTRVALRFGSHCIEFSPSRDLAFVPVLGTTRIESYSRDRMTGLLTHLESVPSPRGPNAHDGPRHVKAHPNGKVLYCVTEHANTVEMYAIGEDRRLKYVTSRSLLPSAIVTKEDIYEAYRGDTLALVPPSSPRLLFATTRGSTGARRGYVSVFQIDEEGRFAEHGQGSGDEDGYYYETRTSGGRANAIELLPKGAEGNGEGWWILITDDDEEAVRGGGDVRVLEWDGWGEGKGMKEVAGWPGEDEIGKDVWMEGGSHAIWLD